MLLLKKFKSEKLNQITEERLATKIHNAKTTVKAIYLCLEDFQRLHIRKIENIPIYVGSGIGANEILLT